MVSCKLRQDADGSYAIQGSLRDVYMISLYQTLPPKHKQFIDALIESYAADQASAANRNVILFPAIQPPPPIVPEPPAAAR